MVNKIDRVLSMQMTSVKLRDMVDMVDQELGMQTSVRWLLAPTPEAHVDVR